jgi:hypothetical protein
LGDRQFPIHLSTAGDNDLSAFKLKPSINQHPVLS